MFRKNLKYLLILALSLSSARFFAQNEVLMVYGQIKDDKTKKELENCKVQVFKEGTLIGTYSAGATGKYDITMPLGFSYDIKFSKDGYAYKIVRINTRSISAEDRIGGFEVNIDGFLFVAPQGFNMNILNVPIAKAAFDYITNSILFDVDYTKKRQQIIDAELKRLEELTKKGQSKKIFGKAGDKNHTYYPEMIPSAGKKRRNLTPQEWKRETGLEPDTH